MPNNNKTIQLSVRLMEEDVKVLDKYCEENDLKRAFVLRQALREYLDRHMDKIDIDIDMDI